MTDKPIDIPALIRDLSPDENVPPLQEHVIAVLEQAQAEIEVLRSVGDRCTTALAVLRDHLRVRADAAQAEVIRLNGLVSFADSTITGLNDRDRYERKQVMLSRVERDDTREEDARLRDALAEMQEAFVVDNTTMTQFQQQATRMADAALAASQETT